MKKTLTPQQYRNRLAKRKLITDSVGCSICGATQGAYCWRKDGTIRRSPHMTRVRDYYLIIKKVNEE